MFANPRYTAKNAPVFLDAAVFEGESLYHTAMRPCIMNDDDNPPKALIELDLFVVPAEHIAEGDAWKKESYDLESSICITPEDTILLIRHLYRLLSELFSDHNYLSELLRYRKVTRPAHAERSVWPKKAVKGKRDKGKAKKN